MPGTSCSLACSGWNSPRTPSCSCSPCSSRSASCSSFAAWTKLPAAIPLVLGGLLLGFVPGLPHVELPPDLVLVAILPPLLYSSAFFTGLRDLRANLRPISLLASG